MKNRLLGVDLVLKCLSRKARACRPASRQDLSFFSRSNNRLHWKTGESCRPTPWRNNGHGTIPESRGKGHRGMAIYENEKKKASRVLCLKDGGGGGGSVRCMFAR